ncbi:MFS transporter [Flagellimonas zhangzhouensis]|uniref:Sugar phosphate permease n=1 Tax=Flagellimonas zhangzhouensis TaxID=1073328 RepID=A0A1H2RNZ2_9FLAO|nr:MFS transporter [Allomuricauda zhangzhouensis]SDQ65486.1 Sugar phosphate permease [Allomuricauda zhangzhouensis]SDW20484.1 Sugar phosphate permease [Allomuricauda zhangzhouensis]
MKATKLSWVYLLLLILSGEAIFILPFVLPRVFRPTVLDVLELDNVQLGLCFSVYGLVAMVSYVIGGPLADKYPPRKLIAIALWMTALGGFLFAQYPDLITLQILYGWWGFTTIFLFWAPMIKATRIWGGADSQGKAFGFLDGGRGLTGFLFSLLGVVVFSFFLHESPEIASLEDRKEAFTYVLYSSSIIIILIGVLVWLFMKTNDESDSTTLERISWKEMKEVLKSPSVWLLMVIILCGYVGYKITDIISQYAEEVMLYNQVDAAKVGTLLQFLRPTTGILFGLIADRLKITWLLVVAFVLTLIGGLLFASGIIAPTTTILFFMSVVVIAAGVYATRALYFGVMQVGKIPLTLTGTAVGLISLIGYTPDVFAGPAYGMLLDAHPGEEIGHQHVFWMLSAFAFLGGIAAFIYHRKYGK